MIEMIVFDYGRTLYDRERDGFFPDMVPVVQALSARYRLSIVSVAPADDEANRLAALKEQGVLQCFEAVLFVQSGAAKAAKFDELLARVGLAANQVAVVDDYVIRGIAWGNRAGATTVWFRNGRFADVLPDEASGKPAHTICRLGELLDIF